MSQLCRRCHRLAPLVDSCRDCLAWGVTRHEKWYCQACRGWRIRYHQIDQACPGCARTVVVNHRGYCRLCCRQATTRNQLNPAHRTLDITAATQHGVQLFFADLILKKRGKEPGATIARVQPRRVPWPPGFPATHEQLVLFDWPHDLTSDRVRHLEPAIPALAAALAQAVSDHGERHGWSQNQQGATWRGIRVLLATQDTPGAPIAASKAAALVEVDYTSVWPVLTVLDSVGMLLDDRQPLQAWFDNRTASLPEPMRHELTLWFHALRDGSTTPPRMRPRQLDTVRTRITTALPIVEQWAADGYESLREITRDRLVATLPTGASRSHTLSAMRSLFRYLKAIRAVFVNPTARLRGDRKQPLELVPVELAAIRDALKSDDPARAAITALMAFHALRNLDVRQLMLVDIRDGRAHVGTNTIPLAEPVRQRINAWLAERARRWPNTANPHLFISVRTAGRTTPVTSRWVADKVGVLPRTIRQDRILNEVIATNGDTRRVADLFGVSVQTAQRYVDVLLRPNEQLFAEADDEP